MARKEDARLSFQEQLDVVQVPGSPEAGKEDGQVRRYMGKRAAWLPGSDLYHLARFAGPDMPLPKRNGAAFGGQVYAQAGMAVCRAWRAEEVKMGMGEDQRLGLHTIHGYFTTPGIPDRPFIYEVTTMTTSRLFATLSVVARQPVVASTASNPPGDHFPLADAALPLSGPCFVAICSFKLPEPHSHGAVGQEASAQDRFRDILTSRPPTEWKPAPPVDTDGVVRLVGADIVGTFPVVEMKKVDMTAYNAGRPLHERRELLLYRLLAPLPADGTDGFDANAHVLAHAFEADRNGLLTLGNHLGIGEKFGRAASLSYSFVVHVNVADAVMKGSCQGAGDGADGDAGWWVQEMSFPRAGQGRGVVLSKIWSPEGLHVATEYQDGLSKGVEKRKKEKL